MSNWERFHVITCNYPHAPIGYAGCICQVVNKHDYAALEAKCRDLEARNNQCIVLMGVEQSRAAKLEAELTEVKAMLRENHGGRYYEPECPECAWLAGVTAKETKPAAGSLCPACGDPWGDRKVHSSQGCSALIAEKTKVDDGPKFGGWNPDL